MGNKLSVAWWEARRLRFNVGLAFSGVVAFLFYVGVWFVLLPPDLASIQANLTPSALLFQAFDWLVVIAGANILYFLWPISEGIFKPDNLKRYRAVCYWLWFSLWCLLPFVIPTLVAVRGGGPPNSAVLSALEAQGGQIVAQIEDYKKTKGSYPTDLAELGVDARGRAYGGWKYTASDDRSWFALSMGDYGRHEFSLTYTSKRRRWYSDT